MFKIIWCNDDISVCNTWVLAIMSWVFYRQYSWTVITYDDRKPGLLKNATHDCICKPGAMEFELILLVVYIMDARGVVGKMVAFFLAKPSFLVTTPESWWKTRWSYERRCNKGHLTKCSTHPWNGAKIKNRNSPQTKLLSESQRINPIKD
jgi:hypothetical protein